MKKSNTRVICAEKITKSNFTVLRSKRFDAKIGNWLVKAPWVAFYLHVSDEDFRKYFKKHTLIKTDI